MKSIKKPLVCCGIFISILVFSQSLALAGQIFSNNFDDGTLQGWGTIDNSGLSIEKAHSGNYSIKVNDTISGGNEAELYKIFSPSLIQGTLDFWFYFPSSSTEGIEILLTDQNSWQKYPNDRFRLYFNPTSHTFQYYYHNIQYNDFPTQTVLSLDTWHHIILSWDCSLNQIRLNVNGTDCGVGYNNNGGSNIQQIEFTGSSWIGINIFGYFDDVTLTDSSSSTPIFGNGSVEVGEQCDDGNVTAGDGCSAVGIIESDWTCSGSPSVCSHTSPPTSTSVGYNPLWLMVTIAILMLAGGYVLRKRLSTNSGR